VSCHTFKLISAANVQTQNEEQIIYDSSRISSGLTTTFCLLQLLLMKTAIALLVVQSSKFY
jgi:hypothetical protein